MCWKKKKKRKKCNLRKSTVKEHLRLQQAVPKHMLLLCFQRISIFGPCRSKASIHRTNPVIQLKSFLKMDCSLAAFILGTLHRFGSSKVQQRNSTMLSIMETAANLQNKPLFHPQVTPRR